MAKKDKPIDIQAIAQAAATEAARLAYGAASLRVAKVAGSTYKETEKRLYAYPDLLDKIQDDKMKLRELIEGGTVSQSKSLVRFARTGSRLSRDEMLDALVQDKEATIAADQHEVDAIAAALNRIQDDPYYITIAGKFVERKTDEDIAAAIPCDPSTVRRNRGRLVRRLAVWLYGSHAL